MKLICAEYNAQREMSPCVVGDNALLRNNNDFYLPGYTAELSGVPQLVFKICKLGKGVARRFAHRYYNEVGVGIRFYADTLQQELTGRNLPPILASSFDESAALSGMMPYGGEVLRYVMLVNGKRVFDGNADELPVDVDELVSQASGFFMLKIGDYLFCGNPFRHTGLQRNDHVEMYLNDVCLLDFYIR